MPPKRKYNTRSKNVNNKSQLSGTEELADSNEERDYEVSKKTNTKKYKSNVVSLEGNILFIIVT